MTRYEYKVVPAPTKGTKARGIKTPQARFANSVQGVLNAMGADGWEYLRAELLPSDERSGLTGTATNWRNILVFRRVLRADSDGFQPLIMDPVIVDDADHRDTDDIEDMEDTVPAVYARSGFHPEPAQDDPDPDDNNTDDPAEPPLTAERPQ